MPKHKSRTTKALTKLKQIAERLQRQAEDLAAAMNKFENTVVKKPRRTKASSKRSR